ncbi:unnamed protein product, partial [Nesidiocoris tenuis]
MRFAEWAPRVTLPRNTINVPLSFRLNRRRIELLPQSCVDMRAMNADRLFII